MIMRHGGQKKPGKIYGTILPGSDVEFQSPSQVKPCLKCGHLMYLGSGHEGACATCCFIESMRELDEEMKKSSENLN